jgi:hypothetical protein
MATDTLMLSLTIEASNISIPTGIPEMDLFSHFQSNVIELLKSDTLTVHHLGMVPDNGADGNDDLLIDGILFRFDVSSELLGIEEDAAPHLVKQAFLTVVENTTPSSSSLLEEIGETKKETTIVFHF